MPGGRISRLSLREEEVDVDPLVFGTKAFSLEFAFSSRTACDKDVLIAFKSGAKVGVTLNAFSSE